jgi:hypothetical protein
VDAYDSALTRTTAPDSIIPVAYPTLAVVGNYALALGRTEKVDAYDAALTRTSPFQRTETDNVDMAATSGDYTLLFCENMTGESTISVYGSDFTKIAIMARPARYYAAAASTGNCALFGGGIKDYGGIYDFEKNSNDTTVEAHDAALTLITAPQLSRGRYYLTAASLGNLVLFGGGYVSTYGHGGVVESKVDAYYV